MVFKRKLRRPQNVKPSSPKNVREIIWRGSTISDLQNDINNRKTNDTDFADNFEDGYQAFKFCALLKEVRQEASLTPLNLADKLNTQKSAISRIENHSEDVKLSTLEKFASALGKKLEIKISLIVLVQTWSDSYPFFNWWLSV